MAAPVTFTVVTWQVFDFASVELDTHRIPIDRGSATRSNLVIDELCRAGYIECRPDAHCVAIKVSGAWLGDVRRAVHLLVFL
ncbi:hypothetical protein E2C01_041003 [Portunus trituberculatus]|uniref:Uncharacterized protein n=1 Tax=Portunus trituberculatus TaxID=210409 RepID=A0A5B7FL97_PORTR|nr:hypothetical protein [Portunus trituberculatus]